MTARKCVLVDIDAKTQIAYVRYANSLSRRKSILEDICCNYANITVLLKVRSYVVF